MKPALKTNPNPVPAAPLDPLDAVLGGPAVTAAPPLEPEPTTATTRKPAKRAERTTQQRRAGTMRAPYERSDGARVRQWSLTLPVEVIQEITIRATRQNVKPAEYVLSLLRKHIAQTK